MADAMVTGRMPQAKKDAGNNVLKSLGLSASQAINQLYDYLIAHNEMPLDTTPSKTANKASLEEALTFVRSIPQENRFSSMSDDDIKRNKLLARGFTSSEGGEN